MGDIVTGMEAVWKPGITLIEISLAIFGFMVVFFVIYLLLGKI